MAPTGEKLKMPVLMTSDSTLNARPLFRHTVAALRAAVCVVPLAMALEGCSSLNPVHWFDWAMSGDVQDDPDLDQPVMASGRGPALAGGLVADQTNSNYAAPVHRDVSETKPLVKRPVSEIIAATPSPDGTATPVAPSGPPAYTPVGTVPAKPDIPDTVPVAGKSTSLLDHYHQRLKESAAMTVPAQASASAGLGSGLAAAAPVHLTPPKSAGTMVAASGTPESSFQIATLAFTPGSNKLSPSDLESLREAVKLYKKIGGYVRVLGLGVSDNGAQSAAVFYSSAKEGTVSAQTRADAVAHELVRLGVPGSKILVGAVAPGAPPAADGAAARIYLDM